jgi:3-deoxy-D-manno-octulosonic-acid transferase
VTADFLGREAFVQVRDEAELGGALERLLADPAARAALGRRAAETVRAGRGVLKASADRVAALVRPGA